MKGQNDSWHLFKKDDPKTWPPAGEYLVWVNKQYGIVQFQNNEWRLPEGNYTDTDAFQDSIIYWHNLPTPPSTS